MSLPLETRKLILADPETRRKFRVDLIDPRQTLFHRRWDLVMVDKVVKPENEKYAGKSVADVAAMRSEDQLDAFLNLALEEDLGTEFQNANSGGDQLAMAEILRSPYVLVGNSDAGAHVQYGAQFGYGTTLLGLWVRERGVMSLEQAIHKLTFEVASVYGLAGRGSLQTGYAADLAVFDPEKIKACAPEWAHDYPAGTKRLIQRAIGNALHRRQWASDMRGWPVKRRASWACPADAGSPGAQYSRKGIARITGALCASASRFYASDPTVIRSRLAL